MLERCGKKKLQANRQKNYKLPIIEMALLSLCVAIMLHMHAS